MHHQTCRPDLDPRRHHSQWRLAPPNLRLQMSPRLDLLIRWPGPSSVYDDGAPRKTASAVTYHMVDSC
jgi:hypothetical protein